MSFLSNRSIRVNVNNVLSKKYSVDLGVAQGSILAPLIFVLFINDMSDHIPSGCMINSAYDTCIAVAGDNVSAVEDSVSRIVEAMDGWCKKNRLIMNKDNTVRIHFHSANGQIVTTNQMEYTKFLGIYIDTKLSWSKQID
ncbi:Reverse transcriptase (RNA-dependent DNA polymerase) [Popillia japonica]|uniref:Reverse transcriptase (RNA-dependent DNA polymerase) n=1 Tax=Popillia japonica TaxID=7064 RepID=A0AAW1IAX3_POPJA